LAGIALFHLFEIDVIFGRGFVGAFVGGGGPGGRLGGCPGGGLAGCPGGGFIPARLRTRPLHIPELLPDLVRNPHHRQNKIENELVQEVQHKHQEQYIDESHFLNKLVC
jgi:hypothetical protein